MIHAIEVDRLPTADGRSDILTADNVGVSLIGDGVVTTSRVPLTT